MKYLLVFVLLVLFACNAPIENISLGIPDALTAQQYEEVMAAQIKGEPAVKRRWVTEGIISLENKNWKNADYTEFRPRHFFQGTPETGYEFLGSIVYLQNIMEGSQPLLTIDSDAPHGGYSGTVNTKIIWGGADSYTHGLYLLKPTGDGFTRYLSIREVKHMTAEQMRWTGEQDGRPRMNWSNYLFQTKKPEKFLKAIQTTSWEKIETLIIEESEGDVGRLRKICSTHKVAYNKETSPKLAAWLEQLSAELPKRYSSLALGDVIKNLEKGDTLAAFTEWQNLMIKTPLKRPWTSEQKAVHAAIVSGMVHQRDQAQVKGLQVTAGVFNSAVLWCQGITPSNKTWVDLSNSEDSFGRTSVAKWMMENIYPIAITDDIKCDIVKVQADRFVTLFGIPPIEGDPWLRISCAQGREPYQHVTETKKYVLYSIESSTAKTKPNPEYEPWLKELEAAEANVKAAGGVVKGMDASERRKKYVKVYTYTEGSGVTSQKHQAGYNSNAAVAAAATRMFAAGNARAAERERDEVLDREPSMTVEGGNSMNMINSWEQNWNGYMSQNVSVVGNGVNEQILINVDAKDVVGPRQQYLPLEEPKREGKFEHLIEREVEELLELAFYKLLSDTLVPLVKDLNEKKVAPYLESLGKIGLSREDLALEKEFVDLLLGRKTEFLPWSNINLTSLLPSPE